MEGRINRQQRLAKQIKKEPNHQQTRQELKCPNDAHKTAPIPEGLLRKLLEARSANDAVIVLGDALPAIEMPAFRAARRRFALGMVEATLVDEVWRGHQVVQRDAASEGGAEWVSSRM